MVGKMFFIRAKSLSVTTTAAVTSARVQYGGIVSRVPAFPTCRMLSTCRAARAPSTIIDALTVTVTPPQPPARWLSDLRARVGKCIMFGCSPAQVAEAGIVLRALATEWRELTAGCEGFLTGERRGLEDQKVVWGEMDSFSHVNNVMYARYAESGRVNWILYFGFIYPEQKRQWTELMTPRSIGLILKSLKTDFKFPMTYPDTISVYHKLRASPLADPKATSLFLDSIILSHRQRRIAARTFEDISVYDYRAAAKTQLPDFMQVALGKVWEQQEAEKRRARTRIAELAAAVERLEKQTWNRADAVEDMGSAKPS